MEAAFWLNWKDIISPSASSASAAATLKGLIHDKQGLRVVGLSDGFVYQLRHDISAVSKSDRSATMPGGLVGGW